MSDGLKTDLDIQTMPVTLLNDAPYNPRRTLKPGDKEYDSLRRSVEEFTLVEPLVWNKRTGNLVGGHQRLHVLKDLGYTEVQVSVVDLDPLREKALNVALNKVQGEWDTQLLRTLLLEVDEGGALELTGFDAEELATLLSDAAEIGTDEDDKYPEMELQPFEHYDYLVLFFRNTADFLQAAERLGIQKVAFVTGGKKKAKIGMCRVLDGKRVMEEKWPAP